MQRFAAGDRVEVKLTWPSGKWGRATYIRWLSKDNRHLVLFEGEHALLVDYQVRPVSLLDQLAEIE